MDNQVIAWVQGDMNGDGMLENIALTGERPEGQLAWQNLQLEIGDGKNCPGAVIPLPGQTAYDPYLAVGRFTGSRREQVLAVLPTGGSGGIVNFYMYGLEKGKYAQMLSSDQYVADYPYVVSYQNGFSVRVDSQKNGARYLIDLAGRSAEYLDGLYDQSGNLKAPQEGFVSPVGLIYPADVDGNGVLELILYQQISGLYRADQLGFVINRLAWDGSAFALSDQMVAVPPIADNNP